VFVCAALVGAMRSLLFPAGGMSYVVASFGVIGAALLIVRWRVRKSLGRARSR
jgi:hypothetical protein